MSGMCNSCASRFSLFKKEKGCKNCGYSFCKDCLASKKVPVPRLKNEKHEVCKKCFDILTGKSKPDTQPAKYSPPENFKKRLAALNDPNAPKPLRSDVQIKGQTASAGGGGGSAQSEKYKVTFRVHLTVVSDMYSSAFGPNFVNGRCLTHTLLLSSLVLSLTFFSHLLAEYSTDAHYLSRFCAVSRQKLHPYHMRIIELCPKDLYSLFGSRLLRISTQIVSTRLSYSIQYSLHNTLRDHMPKNYLEIVIIILNLGGFESS